MNSTRSLFAYLPPPAECLAILVGTAELTLFGIGGFANQVAFAEGYGLPLVSPRVKHPGAIDVESKDKDSAALKQEKALISAIAARNLQNGVCILAFALYWRDRRATGTMLAAGLIATLSDTLLVRWYGTPNAVWGHLIGVVNSIGIGGCLLLL